MQLEAGKKYTDRRGRVYGPLVTDSQFYAELFGCQLWHNDGRITPGKQFDMDLVAEYVEPVQPDNRVPAGEGYRLLNVGESEQKGDQWFDRIEGQWRDACLISAKINNNDILQGYSIRRKVEQPAAVESPDDWVTQDRVPGRVGVDQECWSNWRPGAWSTVSEGQACYGRKMRHGEVDYMGDTLSLRCRRKDLPPVPPAEPEFPQYIIYATGGTFADCAYIVRTSEDDAYSVLANGKRGVDFKWVAYKANILKSGVWKRVTEKEAEKLVSRTRTVVLKEWLCWDETHPDTVSIAWRSVDPSDEETNSLVAFDHAHATGNTRTVEIPVT